MTTRDIGVLDGLWRELCEAFRTAATNAGRGLRYDDPGSGPVITAQSGSTLIVHRARPHMATCTMRFRPNRDNDEPNTFDVHLQDRPRALRRHEQGLDFEPEGAHEIAQQHIATFTRIDGNH